MKDTAHIIKINLSSLETKALVRLGPGGPKEERGKGKKKADLRETGKPLGDCRKKNINNKL